MKTNDNLAAHWRSHIDAWQRSGLSQAAYCREHQLVKSRFTYWKNKLQKSHSSRTVQSGPGFVPVEIIDAEPSAFTVRLPNGVALEGVCEKNLALVQQLISVWL